MPRNARLGDPIDHGGEIITASPDTYTNGIRQARVTDKVRCRIHGIVEIVTGSPVRYVNGLQAARLGDLCSCGAKIIDPVSPDTWTGDDGGAGVGDLPLPPDVTTRFQGQTITTTGRDVYLIENVDDQPNPPLPPFLPDTNPPVQEQNNDVPPATTIPPCNCGELPDNPPENYPVGAGLVVSNVSSNAVVSKYVIPPSKGNLTRKDIVCNLQAVVENCYAKIIAQYPGGYVTSGFRNQGGKSQHERGEAIDIQWGNASVNKFWEIANWAKDNIEFDQMLVEYHATKPVLHVSYKCTGNRKTIGTLGPSGKYESGFRKYR